MSFNVGENHLCQVFLKVPFEADPMTSMAQAGNRDMPP